MLISIKNTFRAVALIALCSGLGACGNDEAPAKMQTETVAVDKDATDVVVAASQVVTASANEQQAQASPPLAPLAAGEAGETPPLDEAAVGPSAPKQLTVFAGATSFSPLVLFANPGDEVCWVNMTAHDAQSIDGLIPDAAEAWHVELGRNGCVTLPVEGAYIYKCNPHYPVGMAGAIVVGEATNMEQVESRVEGRAKGVVIKLKRALEARAAAQ